MLYKIQNFENKTPSDISYEEIELACGEKLKVYDIEMVHDLTQFIGFGKYMNNQKCNVYLRGQNDLYNGKLIPSLYRGRTNLESITEKYNKRMNKLNSHFQFHPFSSTYMHVEHVVVKNMMAMPFLNQPIALFHLHKPHFYQIHLLHLLQLV